MFFSQLDETALHIFPALSVVEGLDKVIVHNFPFNSMLEVQCSMLDVQVPFSYFPASLLLYFLLYNLNHRNFQLDSLWMGG